MIGLSHVVHRCAVDLARPDGAVADEQDSHDLVAELGEGGRKRQLRRVSGSLSIRIFIIGSVREELAAGRRGAGGGARAAGAGTGGAAGRCRGCCRRFRMLLRAARGAGAARVDARRRAIARWPPLRPGARTRFPAPSAGPGIVSCMVEICCVVVADLARDVVLLIHDHAVERGRCRRRAWSGWCWSGPWSGR